MYQTLCTSLNMFNVKTFKYRYQCSIHQSFYHPSNSTSALLNYLKGTVDVILIVSPFNVFTMDISLIIDPAKL